MEMRVKVSFYEDEGGGKEGKFIFSEYLFHVPRVGDLVSYSFSPMDADKWAQESLDTGREGSDFGPMEVTKVYHLIRVVSLTTKAQGVVCLVRKAPQD